MGRRRRVAVVAGTAALLWGVGASFGAGSALAGSLIGGCGGQVQGAPGTPVAISLGPAKLVSVGAVPATGSAVLSAPSAPLVNGPVCSVLATAVETGNAAAAPALKGAEGAGSVVRGAVGAPAQPASEQPASAQQPQQAQQGPAGAPAAGPVLVAPPALQLVGPFLPANFTSGTSKWDALFGSYNYSVYDYSKLFAAHPGLFGKLPSGDLFGYSPGFGIYGAQDSAGAAQDVAAAGRAESLPSQGADRVALPVLVAVLMLAAVTAAVVRSWAHGARA